MFRRLAMVTGLYAALEVLIHTTTSLVRSPAFLFPLLHQARLHARLPACRCLPLRARVRGCGRAAVAVGVAVAAAVCRVCVRASVRVRGR